LVNCFSIVMWMDTSVTRSSVDADIPARAFTGQSRSLNMTPFDMSSINYLLLSASSSISCGFWHISFRKYRSLEIWIRGHSMSSKLEPFNRLVIVSY